MIWLSDFPLQTSQETNQCVNVTYAEGQYSDNISGPRGDVIDSVKQPFVITYISPKILSNNSETFHVYYRMMRRSFFTKTDIICGASVQNLVECSEETARITFPATVMGLFVFRTWNYLSIIMSDTLLITYSKQGIQLEINCKIKLLG
ncbi:hypothetical protein FGIG_11044 [Fasciola gigantica]|uniref:Uncharacterized protein n=1 Tax=Fasciola gigantica TaxID=46835 RepID=A0A504Z585_FASGI|nr:hypothetical protein FGIG_11044 [Fasciola gigantica]